MTERLPNSPATSKNRAPSSGRYTKVDRSTVIVVPGASGEVVVDDQALRMAIEKLRTIGGGKQRAARVRYYGAAAGSLRHAKVAIAQVNLRQAAIETKLVETNEALTAALGELETLRLSRSRLESIREKLGEPGAHLEYIRSGLAKGGFDVP
jgi:5-keto 4-deoxyuronate isomerase